jgi:hypothetical protein
MRTDHRHRRPHEGVSTFAAVAILVALFTFPAIGQVATSDKDEECYVELDAPWSALPNTRFPLSVQYVGDRLSAAPITVKMETTSGITYFGFPSPLTLEPGQTVSGEVSLGHTVSGLAQIMVSTKPTDPNTDSRVPTDPPRLAIDSGFSGTIEWRKPRPIDSYSTESVVISFVDNHHRAIQLDAPIRLCITAPPRSRVREDDSKPWKSTINIDVPANASETVPFEVTPLGFSASTEELNVVGYINAFDPDKQFLFRESVPFQVVPPIWMRLAVTVVGALLCSLWLYSRRAERVLTLALGKAIFSSLVAALVAFALADLNVLGIRIDATQLTGYFVIGVMVSYVGLDQMLERVVKKASDDRKRSDADRDKGSTPTTPSDTTSAA